MIKKVHYLAISFLISMFFSTASIVAQETTGSGLTITTDGVTTNSDDTNNDGALSTDRATATNIAYVCTLNGLQRRVEIALLNAPAPVPCEVNYYKDSEAPGAKTTLWSAYNDGFYCEHQAKTFVEKLEAMSWSCSQG